ncbi:MAG: hypothetical protein CL605_13995 [Altibacter sp.]|nr:hypothetical protein [Altibacter sp.]
MFLQGIRALIFTFLLTNFNTKTVNNYTALRFDFSKFFCPFTTVLSNGVWFLSLLIGNLVFLKALEDIDLWMIIFPQE